MIETIEKPGAIEAKTERGHWRCVFAHEGKLDRGQILIMIQLRWDKLAGHYVAPNRFANEAAADAAGPRGAAEANAGPFATGVWTYVRAEFFPEL